MKSFGSFAKFYEFTRIAGMGMEVIKKVEPITQEIFEGDGDPEIKALNIAKRIFADPKSTIQEKMFISWAIGFISGVNTTTSALDKMAECAERGSCEECTDECPYEHQEEFDFEEEASTTKKDRTIN